jgi:hypothetical protein
MSSPKTATKPAGRARSAARPAAARAKKMAPAPAAGASADAVKLAAEIERGLADGHRDVIEIEALQQLMAAACKAYAARIEGGNDAVVPLPARTTVTPTEVMLLASGLLRSANLAVFELGMWQSWTGR